MGPVAVVRGRGEDEIHAFANVCAHRGARIVGGLAGEESGSATKVGFICPYHAWTYDLDGVRTQATHNSISRDQIL